MTQINITSLLPIIVLAAAIVIVMLAVAFYRNHKMTNVLTLLGLACSFATLPGTAHTTTGQITPLLIIDNYALFYTGLILIASFVVTLMSYGYFESAKIKKPLHKEEFYILLLISTLGAVVLVSSNHFASFFLGLELLSISLLAMIAYPVNNKRPLEGGIKYLILAGVSSAFLLFGMAIIYADFGTMEFSRVGTALASQDTAGLPDFYLLAGLVMIITGIGFKLSVVPFHMWVPDVFEGAPAPVAGFLATVSKGAMFALFMRYFSDINGYAYGSILLILSIIAILSMLVGNLLALLQNNIKRILAYSSIAHLGYLLVALLAGGAFAIEAATYYLVAYFVMTLGAFGIVTILSTSAAEREVDQLDEYRGLFWRRPWIAGVFTMMLLSLAGIPLTMGFIAKFYIIATSVQATLWVLVFVLITGSIIGLFYYLRVIVYMFMPSPEGIAIPKPSDNPAISKTGNFAIAALALILVWFGVYPSALIGLIQATTAILMLPPQ